MSFFEVLRCRRAGTFSPPCSAAGRKRSTLPSRSLVFALIFGLVVALLRLSRWRLLRWPAIAYVEFFRGTPALVQLFVIYFGLPDVGFSRRRSRRRSSASGLNGAAYLSEIYRAGIESIHRGQMEAALSLGMTPARAMRYIILPQAMRTMLPPITNFAIVLLKDTALVFTVGVRRNHGVSRAISSPKRLQSARRLSDGRRSSISA